MNGRPKKGASWGRPCSWIRGFGEVVKVERRLSGFGFGFVRASRKAWIGFRRSARVVMFRDFLF